MELNELVKVLQSEIKVKFNKHWKSAVVTVHVH